MSFARLNDSLESIPDETSREPFSGAKTNVQTDPFAGNVGAGAKETSDPFSENPELQAIHEEVKNIKHSIQRIAIEKKEKKAAKRHSKRNLFGSPTSYSRFVDDSDKERELKRKEEERKELESGGNGWSFAGKVTEEKRKEKKKQKQNWGFDDNVDIKEDADVDTKEELEEDPFADNPFKEDFPKDPFSSPFQKEARQDPFAAEGSGDPFGETSSYSLSRSMEKDPFAGEIDGDKSDDPFAENVEVVELKKPDEDPFDMPQTSPNVIRRKSVPYKKKESVVIGIARRSSMPNLVGTQRKADEAPIYKANDEEPDFRASFVKSDSFKAKGGYQMDRLSPILKAGGDPFGTPVEDPFAKADPFSLPQRDNFDDGDSEDESSDIFVPPPPPDGFENDHDEEDKPTFTPINPSSFLLQSRPKKVYQKPSKKIERKIRNGNLLYTMEIMEEDDEVDLSLKKEDSMPTDDKQDKSFEIDMVKDVPGEVEDGTNAGAAEVEDMPLKLDEAVIGETYQVFHGATKPPAFLRPLDSLLNHQVQLVSLVHRFACFEVDFQNENWLVPFGWLTTKQSKQISTKSESRVFDYFVVVKFVKNASGKLEPRLDIPISVGKRRSKLLSKVPSFCFPDFETFEDSPRQMFSHDLEWERFTFTLIGQNLNRIYGFTRRFISPRGRYPMAICLLSENAFHDYFESVMDAVAFRWLLNPEHSFSILQKVLEIGIPGADITVKIPSPQGTVRLYTSSVCNINLEPLFRSLSVDSILFIVSCMLTERRLVFHSESLEKVSDVIHGLMQLLYPFEWQQVCIPILPKSLMHYVGAPMPFIIGLPSGAVEEVSNYGVSTIILVDIDEDSIVTNQDHQTLIGLPQKLSRKLRKILIKLTQHGLFDSVVKAAKKFIGASNPPLGLGFDTEAVSAAFVTFMVQLVGDWRDYSEPKRERTFDDSEKYVEVLQESQLFNVFLETRRKEFIADRYEMLIDRNDGIESFTKCYEYIRSIDIPRMLNHYEKLNVDVVVDLAIRLTTSENVRSMPSRDDDFDEEKCLDMIAAGCDDPLVASIVLKLIDARFEEGVGALHFLRTMRMCLGLCERKCTLIIYHLQKRCENINRLSCPFMHGNKSASSLHAEHLNNENLSEFKKGKGKKKVHCDRCFLKYEKRRTFLYKGSRLCKMCNFFEDVDEGKAEDHGIKKKSKESKMKIFAKLDEALELLFNDDEEVDVVKSECKEEKVLMLIQKIDDISTLRAISDAAVSRIVEILEK